MRLTGRAMVAGVVGRPIGHSLSPTIHNAWLQAAGLDGAYVPLELGESRLEALVNGLRGGSVRGVNVTAPFKEQALALADTADAAAQGAGAANLLLFRPDGTVEARNTDGFGLLRALEEQAPDLVLAGARVVIYGAGGAARSAAAALLAGGSAEVRLVNRTRGRAEALAEVLGRRTRAWDWSDEGALDGADLVVNATTLGRAGGEPLTPPLQRMSPGGVVMDMVYRPLRTALLAEAERLGRTTVDGLAMLIGQAVPSFESLFGTPPPGQVEVRGLALEALA